MGRVAVRVTTVLLCGVVLVALGLAFLGLPESHVAPEPLRVDIDFEAFQPGVTQVRTSPVEVPVHSEITAARIDTVGAETTIDVDLALCQRTSCRPLRAGVELAPGPYEVRIAATLADDLAPGASAGLVGEINIVETHQSTMVDTTVLMAVACAGLCAMAAGAYAVSHRQRVTS